MYIARVGKGEKKERMNKTETRLQMAMYTDNVHRQACRPHVQLVWKGGDTRALWSGLGWVRWFHLS